jgi:hypothetical protein
MHLSIFKSTTKAWVEAAVEDTWDNVADILLVHCGASSKDEVPMYNIVQFKTLDDPTVEWARRYKYVNGERTGEYTLIPNTVRRCKDNVISYSGIVLDVDKTMSMEDAVVAYDGLEYVLYTTWSHTPEHHKFRIIIPFSRDIPKAELLGRRDSIKQVFPDVDPASFSVSQSFYFHSGNTNPFSIRVRGEMIDPYRFEYVEPPTYEPTEYHSESTLDDEYKEAYKQAVVKSLLSCSGLHYAGSNNSNLGVLTLVSICKSIGISFNEYDSICSQMAGSDSSLRKSDIRRSAWNNWTGDRIKKETRDKFIKAYNGNPIVVVREGPLPPEYAVRQLRNKIKIY